MSVCPPPQVLWLARSVGDSEWPTGVSGCLDVVNWPLSPRDCWDRPQTHLWWETHQEGEELVWTDVLWPRSTRLRGHLVPLRWPAVWRWLISYLPLHQCVWVQPVEQMTTTLEVKRGSLWTPPNRSNLLLKVVFNGRSHLVLLSLSLSFYCLFFSIFLHFAVCVFECKCLSVDVCVL